ncbi:MAG: DUF192 domain-containing protein [Treponema sp.]|jgi:uncharacterized membrane protein (UPF0127 family)|nr:DUF192 domain-containing protein [Treponema sp.]
MTFRNAVFLQASLLLLFLSLSCSARSSLLELEIKRADQTRVSVSVEKAETDAERSRGLMYRRSLDDGKGMLFIFEEDEILSFWMKNTFIPLSIAFIASDGRIVEIHDMEAEDLSTIRSGYPCRYALEVPRGWFGRAGIAPGDVVLFNK